MVKKLEFTEVEQGIVTELLKNIGSRLLKKMDKGVEAPTVSGSMNIQTEGRVVTFEITAKKEES